MSTLVLRAWNLEQLGNDYAEFVARYRPLIESLRQHVGDVIRTETAFLLRLVLIHEYRRLLLRDPELPAELLPHDWPGNEARLMCREFYRRLLQPSERHLDQHLQCANGHVPAAQPLLYQRFQTEDPFPSFICARSPEIRGVVYDNAVIKMTRNIPRIVLEPLSSPWVSSCKRTKTCTTSSLPGKPSHSPQPTA